MFNPYQFGNAYQNAQQSFSPMQYQRQEIIQVSGEAGAKAYPMTQNSSVILLDNTAPRIWLKVTDGAGFPTLTPYAIAPENRTDPSTSLEDRVKRLEEILNESDHKQAESSRKNAVDA